MKNYNLAWKATTIQEKRELLESIRSEMEEAKLIGNLKDPILKFGSTCIDVMHTATAAIKLAEQDDRAADAEGWKDLLQESEMAATDCISQLRNDDKKDWEPSDFEVMGVMVLVKGITHQEDALILEAEGYFNQGLDLLDPVSNDAEECLLNSQLLRVYVAQKQILKIRSTIGKLSDDTFGPEEVSMEPIDPKVLTRVYRSLAEACKFLAIHYAEEAGSENQVLKAKAV